MNPIYERFGGFISIKEGADDVEVYFMNAEERKKKYFSNQRAADKETLLQIDKYLNASDNLYIFWDGVLSKYCINFLKEKGYIVTKEVTYNDDFFYKISFDV